MTDQKPDSGDNTMSTDNEATPPEPEEVESPPEQPEEAEASEDAEVEDGADASEIDAASDADADVDADEAEAAGVVAETEAEAADAAAAGAAWTTTPVAPDPEATEAALAALAAKPEVTLEAPDAPPPPPSDEPPDEGTPVLLVGGILVGAFIVALAIVLILFRPFDNLADVDASLSPSPVVTEVPSESPSAIATVAAPDFVELTLEDADALATDYGLVVRVNPVQTDEADPGTVLDQDPAAGEPVEEGSTVELSVAQSVPTNSVPDVSGLDEEDATAALEDAGFVVGDISEEFSDEVPAGGVISTDPATDSELPEGSVIDLVLSTGPATVAVPDIVDLSEADALDELDSAGLTAGDATGASDETIVEGHVISSDPAADAEVAPGSAVAYVLSTGPATVAVPDIVDLSEADALDELDSAGLTAGDATGASDETIVEGHVISSDPAADAEVAPGSAVAYVLSTGPATVAVPDIVDLSEADALDELDSAGLTAGDATGASDETIVEGHVISSDPAADAEVAPGSAVAYVLSTGPATVAVPDIVDLSEADALDELDSAGLTAGDATGASDETIVEGHVISSDPAADAEVAPGSAVAYVLSTGPATVAVPDIVDLSEADALDELDSAGLTAGDATGASDETIVEGHVISSDPAADAEVAPGSAVAYVLSTGPATVAVPDIVDLSEADALDELDSAGLTAGDATGASDETIVEGHVISSDPAADAEVAPGSAVAYVLSTGPATVAVPDIVDLSEADALDELDSAGLTAGDATGASDETIVEGHVISSDPAADAEVAPGSAVAYVLSTGPATVAVPDIVDLSEADALDELDSAGLTAGDATGASDETIVEGHVISSDPAADAEVAPGSAVAYVLSTGPATVAVPDIVDLSEADALDELDSAGLTAGDATGASDETIVEGHVISSDPAADAEVAPGSAVAYVLSTGPATVAVPDIVDLSEADALDELDSAGLTAGDATGASDETIVEGHVISSDPAADAEVAPGSAVAYVLSTGPATVAVPDLSGAAPAADEKITDAGLVVGVTFEVNSDTIPAGDVNDQNPAAGEMAPLGSEVDYTISIGPATVAVPDLSGAAADAADAITAAGLTVGATGEDYSDSVAAGDVISQDPAAGSAVELGTAVSYVESLGVQTVAVPDLSGAAADAADAITAAGLTVGATGEDYSDSVAAGDVISQDPAAGSAVELGTAVSYVESLGVQTVAVPDLSGAAADAADAITAAGLTVGATGEDYSDSVAAGDVISQDPAAGSAVELGTAVSYVESLGVQTVAVPDLSGAAADAPDTISAAGLAVGEATQAYSDSVPAGDVISQDPSAGSEVELGTAVSYVESLGVQTVAVPDLSGAAADAPDTISAAGLAVGEATQAYSDSVPAGDVISQDPSAGSEVELGTAVSYVESLGVQTVAVPDLSGAAADAPDTISAAGLAVGEATQAYSDSVPAGDVISQDPSAGSEVELGTAVSYVESLGVQTVAVPDLSGAAADAPDTISAAGLAVGEATQAYSDSVPAGDVISQDPSAGSEVELGTAVSYVESLGVEQVEVPEVRELSLEDANAAIEAADLTVGEVLERTNATVPAGAAVKTDPAAGEMVDISSAVTLTMSKGPKQVDVPDVVGMTEADALSAIEAAELAPGRSSAENSDTVPAGSVTGTNPATGTTVDANSVVDYVLSLGIEQVTVPEVIDLVEADAITAIEAAGLTAGSVDGAFDDEIVAGNVSGQNPTSGSEVDKGSAVDYIVSDGPTPFVQVPAVRDLPEADAIAAIEAANLVVGTTIERTHESVAVGNAIKTEPQEGSEILQGESVELYLSTGSKFRTIPDVSGQPAADAQSALEAEDLTVVVDERTNAKVSAGDAVKTEPAASTEAEIGDEVTLVVSKGPKQVEIPDVVGMPLADAKTAISDAELKVGNETVVEDVAAKNTVIDQAPATGGQADKNSAVDIIISSGPPQVVVVEVRDVPAADAQARLETDGLVVSTREAHNASVAAGDAVKTDPAAGTPVDVGSEVTLTVSKGPKPAVVPDVVGSKKGAAATAITDAGLVVGAEETVEDVAAKNTVITQDPAADSEVPQGTEVNLTISSGPPSVEIPAVKNTPAGDAQAALEGLGLVVETQERTHASVAAGDAVKTEPAAGETVLVGSDVLLTISKGPKLAVVPDVVGSAQGEAEAAVTDVKLAVGTTEVVEGDEPAGTVVSQDPAMGTEVPEGTAVNLAISAGPPRVEIPAVKNMPAGDARAALEGLGLAVETQERTHASVAAGDAVKTEPAAGELVDVGSSVTLTISKGPKQVAVPSIVGLKKGAANTAIKDAGLKVGESTSAEDLAPANTVIAQDPAADSTVDQNSLVNYIISSGPPLVEIPAVKNESEARAVNALEDAGLVVETQQKTNSSVAAGDAVKTDPAAGELAAVGSTVTLTISKGPKQVTVPNIVGLAEDAAQTAITDAELTVGAASQAENDAPAGTVVDQSPSEGTVLDKGSAVDYAVSTGPAIEPMGLGGDLASSEVMSQLDVIASEVEPVRELELSNTPYDGSNSRQHELALAERVGIVHDTDALKAEERALKRLGLLDNGADLAALLETLYGQALPVAYFEDDGHLSVVEPNDKLDASQRAAAARELDRALIDQEFGLDSTRVGDKTRGDEALAGYALEQGDGTAAMLSWSSAHGNTGQTNDVIVPGDDGIYASMPLLLQREYSFPFLEGRIFVDRLRDSGGWDSVNGAWNRPPESTEQILHPKLYPNERPTTVVMDGIAGRLGNGWKESWQQTMGELRTGVWLANGQPGEQSGPKAAVKLPKANAAAGWGGDRLVSLDGPDGRWAIVWQTKWDSTQDIEQFANAANAVIADLDGAGLVASADVSGGVSNPALVLIANSDETLVSVAEALGVEVVAAG